MKRQQLINAITTVLLLTSTANAQPPPTQDIPLQDTVPQNTIPQGVMALGNRMAELELQLESASIPDRDAAEKEILSFGIAALDFLPAISNSTSPDMRERLSRIRQLLEVQLVTAITQPSLVDLRGELDIHKALEQIVKQSGNQVELLEGLDIGDRKVSTDWGALPFWESMDRLQNQFEMDIDRYGGGPGKLTLTHRISPQPVAGIRTVPAIVTYSNTLRMEITRLEVARNFLSPEHSGTLLDMSIRWEPRLSPIAFDLKYSSLKVIDEFDVEVAVENPERVFSAMVQPEIPEVECRLRLPIMERQIETIKSFSGTIETILAGRMETFEFKDITKLPENTALQKADATVTFEGRGKIDDLQTVRLALSFSQENKALESHRSWAFRNPVVLKTPGGELIEPIGFETYQQTNESLGIQYLFIEIPEGSTLVYQTPAAIVKVEIPFKFLGIPLP